MSDKKVVKLVVEITGQALERLRDMGDEYKLSLDVMLGEAIGHTWERNYDDHVVGDYVSGVATVAFEEERFKEGQMLGFTFPQANGYGTVEKSDSTRVWLKLTEATKKKFPGGSEVPVLELSHEEVFEL